MKGIYLTPKSKQEIEAKIAELNNLQCIDQLQGEFIGGQIFMLESILESATILPVEESWKLSVISITPYKQGLLKSLYKNGVIIQPKQ
jgi:hypothetical protein